MELVDVTVTYLEMLSHAKRIVPPPRPGLSVRHIESPTVAYYRSIYNAVGKQYHWLQRRKMTDDVLAVIVGDPLNELHVLFVDETPAGMAELDRRKPGEVELSQFGLTSEFIGQGLGRWFLQWTIDKAWSYNPKRFELHTCTLDHPAALPNYTKAGFVPFQRETIRREL